MLPASSRSRPAPAVRELGEDPLGEVVDKDHVGLLPALQLPHQGVDGLIAAGPALAEVEEIVTSAPTGPGCSGPRDQSRSWAPARESDRRLDALDPPAPRLDRSSSKRSGSAWPSRNVRGWGREALRRCGHRQIQPAAPPRSAVLVPRDPSHGRAVLPRGSATRASNFLESALSTIRRSQGVLRSLAEGRWDRRRRGGRATRFSRSRCLRQRWLPARSGEDIGFAWDCQRNSGLSGLAGLRTQGRPAATPASRADGRRATGRGIKRAPADLQRELRWCGDGQSAAPADASLRR